MDDCFKLDGGIPTKMRKVSGAEDVKPEGDDEKISYMDLLKEVPLNITINTPSGSRTLHTLFDLYMQAFELGYVSGMVRIAAHNVIVMLNPITGKLYTADAATKDVFVFYLENGVEGIEQGYRTLEPYLPGLLDEDEE
jgi:hypothetical protein